MMTAPKCATNDPSQRGKRASCKVLFGECSRYAVFAVHTRDDAVSWFVSDAERPDPLFELPQIIRQEPTFELAVAGLGN